MANAQQEIVAVTQQLLDTISVGDWAAYEELCDPTLSAFEPEARGHLVEGMDFHRFYFNLGKPAAPRMTTICSPHVRLLGDTAIISYVRLVQKLDPSGAAVTVTGEETRVWQRQNGVWKHVHFHRSTNV